MRARGPLTCRRHCPHPCSEESLVVTFMRSSETFVHCPTAAAGAEHHTGIWKLGSESELGYLETERAQSWETEQGSRSGSLFACCVTDGKRLHFSEPPFPCLEAWDPDPFWSPPPC